MFLLIFYILAFLNPITPLDLYLSSSVICSNNCTGLQSNPFSDLNETLATAYSYFSLNPAETTLNLYFKGSNFIISNQSFPDNSRLFLNWQSNLARNLEVNLRPESCPLKSNSPCSDIVRILIKTQKITISLTSNFSVGNVMFDWRDSLVDYSTFKDFQCYSDDQGCCSDGRLNNISDDCNVNVTSLKRNLIDTQVGFFDGTNSMILILNNVTFINLFSLSTDVVYFSYILRMPTYSRLILNATTFQSLYLSFGIIKIDSFSNITMINSIFSNYNPYNLYESLPTTYFSYCIVAET